MTTTLPELAQIAALYDQGKFLQAYRAGETLGPLNRWAGTPLRIMAGRLAANLNAPRLAWALHSRAWRADRLDPDAIYFYGYTLLERWGPYAARRHLDRVPRSQLKLTTSQHAHLLALEAEILARLRDFESAQALSDEAVAMLPDDPWVHVERASVLQQADRYDDAIAAIHRALSLHPWYRPAVISGAFLLQLNGREQEARTLLEEAKTQLESIYVLTQYGELAHEMGDDAAARAAYEEIFDRYPVLEPNSMKPLYARRTHLAYLCGDYAAALDLARQATDPVFVNLCKSLENGAPEGKRVLLPVGFVRQHYMTCSPATLSAISRFWDMPADHLGLAEAICYDGTPPAKEREWVEDHGWLAREFTVDWDTTVALIDRGIPFTLTTIEPTSAHMQAVIGYDSRYRSLLVRDPSARNYGEFDAESFFTRYRSTGPRGMVLVPRDRQELLVGLALPDEAIYDQMYELQQALNEHRRDDALGIYRRMRSAAGEHRLVLLARRLIAGYDGNASAMLKSTERMLKLFPGDPIHQTSKINCLRQLERREARCDVLREAIQQPRNDPVFRLQYAQEIADDARQHRAALRLLRNVMRRVPSSQAFALLATIRGNQRQLAEAVELYRCAACLDPHDEQLAFSYFRAARFIGEAERAITFLRHRVEQLGARSGRPAVTLFAAYRDLDRTPEGFAALERAIAARPDDTDLQLSAADAWAHSDQIERATQILASVENLTHRAAWLRTAATVARARGDLPQSLAYWREVLTLDPLSLDAHAAVARGLAEVANVAAALDHLRDAARRFPQHFGLHRLWAEWAHDEPAATREELLRHIIRIDPSDAWTHRELAICLCREQQFEAAEAEAEVATLLEPGNTTNYSVRGWVQQSAGNEAVAMREYRTALQLSIDNRFSMGQLFALCQTSSEREEVFQEVRDELKRQVTFGDGLVAFAEIAQGTCDPNELLEIVRAGLTARPDLWHAWCAVIHQLLARGDTDEALRLADEACERFPLLPGAWRDKATVHQARRDSAGQLAALERARELNPQWSIASRELAEACENAGDMIRARRLLDQMIARDPLEAVNHEALGMFLWRQGLLPAALDAFARAVALDPGADRSWQAMLACGTASGREDFIEEQARALCARRPGEARSWLTLARAVNRPECFDEQLAALNRALELADHWVDVYDLKAELLAGVGRYDEALATCAPTVFEARVPLRLRGRRAWVLERRGDLAAAIDEMTRLVAEDREYAWGWHNLLYWHDRRADRAACVSAAEALVRCTPAEPSAHYNLGCARRAAEDTVGAKQAFRRVLDFDPRHANALSALMDLFLADNDVYQSAAVLDAIESHADRTTILMHRIQIAVKRDLRQPAFDLLKTLCETTGEIQGALMTALQAMTTAGWRNAALDEMESMQTNPSTNPQTAAAWAAICLQIRDLKRCRDGLANLRVWPLQWRAAATVYLEQLEGAMIRPAASLAHWRYRREVAKFARKYRSLIMQDTTLWSLIGRSFVVANRNRAALRFMADWSARRDVKPWALANVALALARLGRTDECIDVSRHALTLPPDHSASVSHLWVALGDVLRGDLVSARRRRRQISVENDPFFRLRYNLLDAMIAVDDAQIAAGGKLSFWKACRVLKQHLTKADRQALNTTRATRRIYRRYVRQLARDSGSIIARLSRYLPF